VVFLAVQASVDYLLTPPVLGEYWDSLAQVVVVTVRRRRRRRHGARS
jgi:hypothetical protein